LGPLEVLDGDRPVTVGGARERLVLALLLARVHAPVPIDALIDAVWGDRPPRTAERTVHAYVARLRRTLEPHRPRGEPSTVLVTIGRGYALPLDAARLDAARFEELAKQGSDQLASGDGAASSTLRTALDLWRGEAFGGFREVEACVAAVRRLEERRLGLLEDRLDADLAAGQSSGLVGEIEALLRHEPYRERLWGQLIVAPYRSGRQRDALEAYQRARRLLTDEPGIEPGPDLRRLEAAVLAQDPSADVLQPVPATPDSISAGATNDPAPTPNCRGIRETTIHTEHRDRTPSARTPPLRTERRIRRRPADRAGRTELQIGATTIHTERRDTTASSRTPLPGTDRRICVGLGTADGRR
jgi:DNA-binding SARP family transcriptional activator